jgi:hypothetical protein
VLAALTTCRNVIGLASARAVAPLLCVAGLTSCATESGTLLDSDLPMPPEMTLRSSNDLQREGPAIVNGWFILWGRVDDVNVTADATASRFEASGWRQTERHMLTKRAALTFAKDDRVCLVEIDARRVDPWSSVATVRVRRAGG